MVGLGGVLVAMLQLTNRRIDSMEQRTDQRFTALEQRMNQRFEATHQWMDQRFTSFETRFSALEQRQARLEGLMEGIREMLARIAVPQ